MVGAQGRGAAPTRPPTVPADVPVAVPVGLGQHRPGTGHLDDVAAAEVLVEPAGVRRRDVQAPVRDVASALLAHRPGRGVHEDARVAQPRGVLDVGAVAARGVDRHPVGRGVHRVVPRLRHDHVGARRRGAGGLAQRGRHGLHESWFVDVEPQHQLAGVGPRPPSSRRRRTPRACRPGADPVADVDAVGVDVDRDVGVRRPELGRPVWHGAVRQPRPRAVDVGGGDHRQVRLDGGPVGEVLVEGHRDGLADADDRGVGDREDGGHRERAGVTVPTVPGRRRSGRRRRWPWPRRSRWRRSRGRRSPSTCSRSGRGHRPAGGPRRR